MDLRVPFQNHLQAPARPRQAGASAPEVSEHRRSQSRLFPNQMFPQLSSQFFAHGHRPPDCVAASASGICALPFFTTGAL